MARVWFVLLGVSVLLLLLTTTADLGAIRRFDGAVAAAVTENWTEWVEDVARGIAVLGSTPAYRLLWIPTTALLIWPCRWRHLGVYVITLSVVAATSQVLFGDEPLSRAVRDTLTGSARSYLLPSWPVMVFATVATATGYALLPSGRWRRLACVGVAVLVLALSSSRIYLGLDNVTGDLASALIGSGVAAAAFSLFAPESQFPVTYRRRNRAHLELTPSRLQRIVDAVAEQLGLVVTEIAPYRLAGSAGSTPCRLKVDGATETFLFGKLYATSHLRSDRWYKFIRLLRYGRLEDEGPFASVRRLVEHEDYMLRLFRRPRGQRRAAVWGSGDRPRSGVPAGHAVVAGLDRGARRGSERRGHR